MTSQQNAPYVQIIFCFGGNKLLEGTEFCMRPKKGGGGDEKLMGNFGGKTF